MNYYQRDKKITFTKVWCRGSIMRDLPRHVLAKSTVDPIVQAFASEVEIEITYEKITKIQDEISIINSQIEDLTLEWLTLSEELENL